MLDLLLAERRSTSLSVLALGAHSDDLEIGCGGTLLRLARGGAPVDVSWVVLSGNEQRGVEARVSAADFLGSIDHDVRVAGFRDAFFPHDPGVKEYFEELKAELDPDVILTHARHDLHQDHRVVCELTWNTFRDHMILEYEVPKYDGDLGSPNLYVPLEESVAREKTRLLTKHFASQREKDWFTEDLFLGLMRVRGAECRAPDGFAEGFYARKLRLTMS